MDDIIATDSAARLQKKTSEYSADNDDEPSKHRGEPLLGIRQLASKESNTRPSTNMIIQRRSAIEDR